MTFATGTSNIAWSGRNAWFGAVVAAPAAVVIATGQVHNGLVLLAGAIPAAVFGLPPARQDRRKLLVVGILFGLSVMLGSILAESSALAVVGMFLLGFGGALLASKKPAGGAVLMICLPLTATGLSYVGLANSYELGLLFIGYSAWAFVVALCFPQYETAAEPSPSVMDMEVARDFGVRLGLAAAVATAIGFGFGADHTGWIVASTVLVMRPSSEMMELRSIGRAASVVVGGLAAAWLLTLDLSPGAIAIVGAGAIIAATATNGSRWYVTPAFTTFLILWCLLYGHTTDSNIEYRFSERVVETLVGVAIAYVFGFLVPRLLPQDASSRA